MRQDTDTEAVILASTKLRDGKLLGSVVGLVVYEYETCDAIRMVYYL